MVDTTPTLREAAIKALGMELTTKHAVYLTAESAGKLVDLVLRAALAEQAAEQAEPVETIECTCRAEDMPYGRCCKAPPLKTTDRWESARVADYNAGWNACCAAMCRSSTPAEPWGWAIVDANGDECSTRPRVKRFFGAVNHEIEPFTAEDVAHADRENPGVAPHRVVTLFSAPPAPARQEPPADWSVFNTGAEVAGGLTYAEALEYLTPPRLERGWSAVCVVNKDNITAATAEGGAA